MLIFDKEINEKLNMIYKSGKLTWIHEKLIYNSPAEIIYGGRLLELIDIDRFENPNPLKIIGILRSGYANYSRFPSWKSLRGQVKTKYPEFIYKMHGLDKPYENTGFFFDFLTFAERK